MLLLITFAVVSIGFSFLCSIAEAALLSITPSYIASLRGENPRLFARLRKLKDNIDDPLSAILTLNTVAHTAGATGVGAQVAVVFGQAWVGVASGVMTLAILILSEIIPKTIGARYWRELAPVLPLLLRVMVVVLLPFVWLSKQITRRLAPGEDDTDVRGEISALASIGRDQEALDEDEQRIIQNVLRFHEIQVSSVMTARAVCRYIKPDATLRDFMDMIRGTQFSRFPVVDSQGRAQGYIHKQDVLTLESGASLADIRREIRSVSATTNIEQVFADMLRERNHIAMVYDDAGNWLGIVTLEDILETLLGTDIMDETDRDNVSDFRRYSRQSWSRRLRHGVRQ